jgi:hypothetical protein
VADNVTTPFGTFATDDLAGIGQAQYVKLMDGTADSSAKISGDAANGLDVDVTRLGGTGGVKFRDLSAIATVGVLVVAGAKKLLSLLAMNQNAAKRYLKLYDKATAPTSADTPIATIILQPNQATPILGDSIGAVFTLGIGYRVTTAIADADNTDPTANDVVLFGTYQ